MSNFKILVIAPHLSLKLNNGADIYIFNVLKSISKSTNIEITVVGNSEVFSFIDEKIENCQAFENNIKNKIEASLLTIFHKSHYLFEKFISKNYLSVITNILTHDSYDCIIYSYISSLNIISRIPNLINYYSFVFTHNDEINWFNNIIDNTYNPIIRVVAYLSKSSCNNYLEKYRQPLYIHINQKDFDSYKRRYPYLKNLIVPPGVNINNQLTVTSFDKNKIILVFIGSLSAKMNQDAIYYFYKYFYKCIYAEFGKNLTIRIIGSSPPKRLIQFVNKVNWELHVDVPNHKLQELMAESDFGILPFEYSSGSKLKQLEYLSCGIPFLATTCIGSPSPTLPRKSLVSDLDSEWAQHIKTNKLKSIEEKTEQFKILQDATEIYSWDKITKNLITNLRSLKDL